MNLDCRATTVQGPSTPISGAKRMAAEPNHYVYSAAGRTNVGHGPACRTGDVLIVWKLDRLGRSLAHLVQTVQDLAARGVGFRALQEHLDTTNSGGKLIFHLFAALAEFERDLIRERTTAGLAAAHARGRKGGRPKGVDEQKRKAALALKRDPSYTVREICTIVGISRNTYYKYTREGSEPERS